MCFYRIDGFDSDADSVELSDAHFRYLTPEDVKAMRTAQEEMAINYAGTPAWYEFPDSHLPWVLEVAIPHGDYEHGNTIASLVRQRVSSAMHLVGAPRVFLHGPTFAQPGVPGSLTGQYGINHLGRTLPEAARFHLPITEVQRFRRIYEAQHSISHDSLRIALRRFNASHDRRDSQDGLIDCWVGLEALFSDTAGDIRYKASMRIARYVEPDADKRVALFEALQKAYTERNSLVHGDSDISSAFGALQVVRDSLRRSICLILENGGMPVHTAIDGLVVRGSWPS